MTATAAELLRELQSRGVELAAAGDRLRFRPASAVPPDLRAVLAEHKRELLAALTPSPATEAEPVPTRPSSSAPAWLTGPALARLPEPMQGLTCPRDGWTPARWAAHLHYLAGRCEGLHPDAAARYREAAELLGVPDRPAPPFGYGF